MQKFKSLLLLLLFTFSLHADVMWYNEPIKTDGTTATGHYLSTSNMLIDVARGNVTGSAPISGYGKMVTAGAVTDYIVWPDGVYNVPPAAGVQMSIASTSANDTAAGTGIRSVELHYLDDALAEMTETVDLNGTSAVLTVATNIRFIQCMHLKTVGSLKKAAGNISASNGGTNYSIISVGDNRCSSSARMVPAGKRYFISTMAAGSTSGTSAAGTYVSIVATQIGTEQYADIPIYFPFASVSVQDGSEATTLMMPISFPAGTIIALSATTDKAATIVASWFGWEEDL